MSTQRHKEEQDVMTEAKVGVICLKSKRHQGFLAATRSQERGMEGSFPGAFKESTALLPPGPETSSIHYCEDTFLLFLSHSA